MISLPLSLVRMMRIAWAVTAAWAVVHSPATAVAEGAADGGRLSSAPASRPGNVPRLRCDAPVYTLENVWSGDKVEHAFVIHNDGTAPLAILKVEAACGCFVAEDYPREIEPRGKGLIRVSLQTARASKAVRKEMEIHTNDPLHLKNTLVIEGKLTPRIEVEPLYGANWGRFAPGDSLTKVVRLTNHFTRPMKLELKPPETQPEGATVSTQAATGKAAERLARQPRSTHPAYTVSLKEIEPGKVAELTVTAKANLSEGAHMGQVYLKTGFDEEPELMVPCSLFVPARFETIPIAFSVFKDADDLDKQTLMLRWNGDAPMKILSAEAGAPGVATELSEKEAGRVYYLVVTFGPQSGTTERRNEPQRGSGPEGLAVGPTHGALVPQTSPIEIVLKTDSPERPEIKVPIRPRRLPLAATRRAE